MRWRMADIPRLLLVGFSALVFAVVADLVDRAESQDEVGAVASNAARPTPPSGGGYVEFRAAQIGAYGHSYVVYGRLNGRGQPAERRYADLHPMGGYITMALGHLIPVPGNTAWDDDVLKLPVASAYRRTLNAAEYRKMAETIQRLQKSPPLWNAVSYNCNDFVADVARAAGLRTPSNLLVSYLFVPALRDINEPRKKVSQP